jgi:1-acyl-sn-glycerol-3-phosphate acyltransferase
MEKILLSIYSYFEKHRPVFFAIFFSTLGIAGFFASHLRLEEDISKILPKDEKTQKLNQVFQDSRFMDRLVITMSLRDSLRVKPDSLVICADSLVHQIQNDLGPLIRKIDFKVEEGIDLDIYQTLYDHLPVYLDEKDYASIDSLIDPQTVRKTLEKNIRLLSTPASVLLKDVISRDPVDISSLAWKKIRQLQYDENFQVNQGAILTKDEKHLLIFVTPAFPPNNTGKNALLIDGLEKIRSAFSNSGFSNIYISSFGAVAVAEGNARQLRKDSALTLSITTFFLIFFIGWFFRKKRAALIVLIPVVYGAIFSLAAVYLIRGRLSVIALGTGSVILGIAVNYSLHVYNHYRHTRDMQEVIRDLAAPLTIGSFTSIGGFLCLEFVKSEMLRDLGLFAAFSLIGAAICSLVFLPHFISSRNDLQHRQFATHSWIDSLSFWRPDRNRMIILMILVLTVIFAFMAGKVKFESDLTRMNYMSPALKQSESALNQMAEFSLKSVYVVASGNNLNEALIRNEKLIPELDALKEHQIIKKYSGVSSIILSDSLQKKRIATWNSYWTEDKKKLLLQNLEKEGIPLKYKPTAFESFAHLLNRNYLPVDPSVMDKMRSGLLDDYITEKPNSVTVVTLVKVEPEHKDALFQALGDKELISVLDKQYLTEKFVGLINADFTSIALMTSILVFLVLLLTYGRIELTLISFIPMFISFVWILGIMSILDIRFNIINIIISALIFGLGDDYSLFILDGLLQEYKTGKKNLPSFKSSIILSAMTTLAGLGVLIFARHPALRSIAWLAIIGMICVVFIAQTLIPFLFGLLIGSRTRKGRFPWTFLGLAKSIFSFSYFALGCILLTIIGTFLIRLNPFNREKGKIIYHKLLSAYTWSVLYIMGNVKKRIINSRHEDFSKPSVIICNHQSFLDILISSMLNPKLILLTNRWVWNSPVFGEVVRLADYYPVQMGIENSIDLLAERVGLGYSIVVFPEGTRSADGAMKRFHKGAFYLAERLSLDILPILIHGSGYTMTKGDFLLKDGQITVEYLPRIKPGNEYFGKSYAEKAKMIGRYFRSEYGRLRAQMETPAYFREQLIYNYIYKGPVLEWYLRIKLRLEKNYLSFHQLVPLRGKILDIGCGYGFLTYMLHFTSEERTLTGVDYDEEKISMAAHCFSKNEKIDFVHGDILQFQFGHYDAILLSDLLHYLQPPEQQFLIKKCISSLNDSGIIIIREGNKELSEKHRRTRLSEFFSTKITGFNKVSANGLSFLSGQLIRDTASSCQMELQEIQDSKFTSNTLFVLRRQSNYAERTI